MKHYPNMYGPGLWEFFANSNIYDGKDVNVYGTEVIVTLIVIDEFLRKKGNSDEK